MTSDGTGNVGESKLGSPGIFTAVLTLIAACFALLTFARSYEFGWEYPYLTLEDPARSIFLRAEYERRVAQSWPSGVPGGLGQPEGAAQAFADLGEEVTRAGVGLPGWDGDPIEALTVTLHVVAAGWGQPESLAAVRSMSEVDAPDYLVARLREIKSGDTAADRARALVARRWHASALILEALALGGAVLAALSFWRRRANGGEAHALKPVTFGPAQAWVVFSWSFAALALAWRFSYLDVPVLSDLGRTVYSFVLAVVALVLVRDTRASESRAPLRRMLRLPGAAKQDERWSLLAIMTFGAIVAFGYVVSTTAGALGGRPAWSELLTEPLIHGSGFVAFVTILELVVFAPLGEELLFRGVLFGALTSKLSVRRAALLSGVAFSVWHGYGVVGSLIIAFDGYLLALLYARTRSLVPGMFVHGALNAIYCLSNLGCRV